jgi:hypothetical protein
MGLFLTAGVPNSGLSFSGFFHIRNVALGAWALFYNFLHP